MDAVLQGSPHSFPLRRVIVEPQKVIVTEQARYRADLMVYVVPGGDQGRARANRSSRANMNRIEIISRPNLSIPVPILTRRPALTCPTPLMGDELTDLSEDLRYRNDMAIRRTKAGERRCGGLRLRQLFLEGVVGEGCDSLPVRRLPFGQIIFQGALAIP